MLVRRCCRSTRRWRRRCRWSRPHRADLAPHANAEQAQDGPTTVDVRVMRKSSTGCGTCPANRSRAGNRIPHERDREARPGTPRVQHVRRGPADELRVHEVDLHARVERQREPAAARSAGRARRARSDRVHGCADRLHPVVRDEVTARSRSTPPPVRARKRRRGATWGQASPHAHCTGVEPRAHVVVIDDRRQSKLTVTPPPGCSLPRASTPMPSAGPC